MTYHVVTATTLKNLEAAVNLKLQAGGYHLHGGLVIETIPEGKVFMQVIVQHH
jgi:hypothetical protein